MRSESDIHIIHSLLIIHTEHEVTRLNDRQTTVDQCLILCGCGQWVWLVGVVNSPGLGRESTREFVLSYEVTLERVCSQSHDSHVSHSIYLVAYGLSQEGEEAGVL